MKTRDGGDIVADALVQSGVRVLFSLCGGHIAPILVGAAAAGIRVVDTRHEASAVFAADALARSTGGTGAAAVTAGPGLTNALGALKNAQVAETPLLVLTGAPATLLRGRGALQDVDQLALVRPVTKWAQRVPSRAALAPLVRAGLRAAHEGVPGPCLLEIPIDLLYSAPLVREWTLKEAGAAAPAGVLGRALRLYLEAHLLRLFHTPHVELPTRTKKPENKVSKTRLSRATRMLRRARRPVLLVGSQALVGLPEPKLVAEAIERLSLPTYLAGMARGLLGRRSNLQLRHRRRKALACADLVIAAGSPFDFRLGYGRGIAPQAQIIAINLSTEQLYLNRSPDLAIQEHPGRFLRELASFEQTEPVGWLDWLEQLRQRDKEREHEIAQQAAESTVPLNPLYLLSRIEEKMAPDAVLIVDGGDFVGTASYLLRPRAPLSWLDPGAFGTLGVGGGFALGATSAHPDRETWLLYGDGSCAFSIAEIDTCVRHGLAPIMVVGNDASWGQIARDQVDILASDIGTRLRATAYHQVAEGYGGIGIELSEPDEVDSVLDQAREISRAGKPCLINAHLASSDFRKGSISM